MAKETIPLLNVSEDDKNRFWGNAALTANLDKCWQWQLSDKSKYGKMTITSNKKQTSFSAHRLAYFIYYGVDPIGNIILHSCDNPKCVNPNHLSLGTSQDNSKDMIQKGRGLNQFEGGEKHHHARLTAEIVIELRKLFAEGSHSVSELSNKYNIDPSAISRIINRKRWNHI